MAAGGACRLDPDRGELGLARGIALADVGINVPGLSGMVYLERAPIYLHLGFDVHLSSGATYTIKEMRSVQATTTSSTSITPPSGSSRW